MVTGPPGAGKSTVAKMLADRLPVSVVVAGDAFFGFLASGMIEPWLPESRNQNEIVATAASAATRAFVIGGYRTVFDGVLGPWSLPLFTAALRPGIGPVDYAILLPPVEVCVERVASRIDHGFRDEPATRKMHHEFAAALTSFPDRHVFGQPADDAEVVTDAIEAAAAAGSLQLDDQGTIE